MKSGTKLAIAVLALVLASAAFLYRQVQREIEHQDCLARQALATSGGSVATTPGCE